MRNAIRVMGAVGLAMGLLACASESDGANTAAGGPVPVATGGCAGGATVACTCADGSPGQASCQVDGTYGLCSNCGQATALGAGTTGSGAQAANAAGTEAGAAGAPAPTEAATMEATPSTMPSNEPVIVPPEDVAACNPLGQPPAAGEEVEVLEIRTSDVVAGGFASQGGTYYGCFWIEIDMPEKHHIIGWEGAIAGNPSIHHQQVSLGEKPFYLFNQGGLCGLPSVEFTWTGEKPTEWTPGMAGYPIGGPENGGKARFLWQVHFEGGATTYTGGFNAVITKNLRKYDAGNFEQGDVAGILVPAMSSTTHVATCTSEMTQQKLTHPIYVWSTLLHAHLFVDRIRSELYRGGQKIFTFDDWTTGPFGALADQQFKPLNPCVEILPGDEIVTTCDYTNTLATDVVGGEATNQEMCTNFMPYFPRLPNNSANFCGTIDSSGGGVAP